MGVDFTVYLPTPVTLGYVQDGLHRAGWTIRAYPPAPPGRQQLFPSNENIDDCLDVYGWRSGELDDAAVIQTIESGRAVDVADSMGVCEILPSTGSELAEELQDLLSDDTDGDVAASLNRATVAYTVAAPIGSRASYTPDLQDALVGVLGAVHGAICGSGGDFFPPPPAPGE